MNFQLIETFEGWRGDARLYRTPKGQVVVSRANTLDRGDETMIFKWLPLESAVNWTGLYAGYGESHETALTNWLSE